MWMYGKIIINPIIQLKINKWVSEKRLSFIKFIYTVVQIYRPEETTEFLGKDKNQTFIFLTE
jgi:hypothetical protein